MGKKALEPITESMFYVLLCLQYRNMYGTEIADRVRQLTGDRVKLGPGTLYAILSTFEAEGVILRVSQKGRSVTYTVTEKGKNLYHQEVRRLQLCLADAQRDLSQVMEQGTEEKQDLRKGMTGEPALG